MPRLQARSFSEPDDVRTATRLRFETVGLDDATVGYCTFEPGWRWSTDIGPMMGTTTCPIRHLGYSMSGAVRVVMDDGQTLDIGPHTVFDVPPGHDQWVIGDEPWVAIEWGASGRALEAALNEAGTRSLGTLMFTDIVDSTARLQAVGDAAWRDLLAAHNARLREQLNIFRGREVKTTGDGVLAIFDSPTRAIQCAAAMTRSTRVYRRSRFELACTPVRWSSSATTFEASRCIRPRGCWPWRAPARCSSRRPPPASSTAPA